VHWLLLWALLATPAAPPADALIDVADVLSADPDRAELSIGFRDQLGATVGAEVPVLGDGGAGFNLRVPVMVELHNRLPNATPNNYWRGLLSVVLSYRVALGDPLLGPARLSVRLFHESDHVTWGSAVENPEASLGFYEFNGLGLGGALPLQVGGQRLVFSAEARLHLVTCNLSTTLCGSGAQGWGSPGFEGRAGVVWPGAGAGAVGGWSPMAALFLDWLAPHALIRTERRLVVHLGAYLPTERRGTFQVYLLGWWGNDVGFLRRDRIAQAGIGLGWSPR
jgi:hypothetical protein